MSLTQALSTALAGLNATQANLSVISGNVANINTAGYVEETANQVEIASAGSKQGVCQLSDNGRRRYCHSLGGGYLVRKPQILLVEL